MAESLNPECLTPLGMALQAFDTGPEAVPAAHLTQLVAGLRPAHADDGLSATHRVQALSLLLSRHPEWAASLRGYLKRLLAQTESVSLLAECGIQPNTHFLGEAWRRMAEKGLPTVTDSSGVLLHVLREAFCRSDDYRWVEAVPAADWLVLFECIGFQPEDRPDLRPTVRSVLQSLAVISHRVAALGLEPEVARHAAAGAPFVGQCQATEAYVADYQHWLEQDNASTPDDRPLLGCLAACEGAVAQIRAHAAQAGVSLALTYHLQRLTQQLERMQLLIRLLAPSLVGRQRAEALLVLLKTLIRADNRRNSLRDLWRENMDLLARQVTEHAGRKGEHYVARNRPETRAMLLSAMGAGLIVPLMALIKLHAGQLHAPPLIEALLFSLNYAAGFMLIHVLHFTIATKQPAMTAARIAATIQQQQGQAGHVGQLADLAVQIFRTQWIAILGNVGVALPLALLTGWLWITAYGTPYPSPEKAHHLLQDLHPWHSLALFHAAIAGVFLFLSGLISGYYDNLAVYRQIPERVAHMPMVRRWLGGKRADRLGDYLARHLGALAGNAYFGIFLGSTATVGLLLGLPLDIRHITFAAANFSYAVVALDFALDWQDVVVALLGIALIGAVNLSVSFSLALTVALRARKVGFERTGALISELARRFLRSPRQFFWPPRG